MLAKPLLICGECSKTSITAPNFVSNRPLTPFITTHLGAEVIERRRCRISSVQRFTLTRH